MKTSEPPIFLGLDYGDKRIGVSVSDRAQMTAQPVETIHRADANSFKKPLARLKEILRAYECTAIVLGFPKRTDNSQGRRCAETLAFKERMERYLKKYPVILWDERFSTIQAERGFAGEKKNSVKYRRNIDQAAAVIILQNYLDFLRNTENPPGGARALGKETTGGTEDYEDSTIITMIDEEGIEREYIVIASINGDEANYILVADKDEADEDEAVAVVLKEISTQGDEHVYEIIEDDDEFERAVALFQNSSEDYDIEI